MDDDFEGLCNDDESITSRRFDKLSFVTLWLQHKAAKKMVQSDLYSSFADALLMHRAYKDEQMKFQESASREIEALVAAVEGANHGSSN